MVYLSVLAEMTVIVFGAFLLIDSLFLHLITFDYVSIGIEEIDGVFDHWMVGAGLVAIGLAGLFVSRKRHGGHLM
jgi:LPXTG-motif cell wall-anchored protein